MSRVALYARYSSNNQHEISLEDQFHSCREHAAREKWRIVKNYADSVFCGVSTILRPGIQALLRDAQIGTFDAVLAETLARISHDQFDMMTLFKDLRFAGIAILTVAEREISMMDIGIKNKNKQAIL